MFLCSRLNNQVYAAVIIYTLAACIRFEQINIYGMDVGPEIEQPKFKRASFQPMQVLIQVEYCTCSIARVNYLRTHAHEVPNLFQANFTFILMTING